MQEALDRIASALLNIVYPARCPVCDCDSDTCRTAPLCSKCWNGINRYGGPSCGICGEPFTSGHAAICGRCLIKHPPFEKARSYGLYTGALREAVHLLKFKSVKRLSGPLGHLLARLDIPRVDCIVSVPLSPRGLRERGFNQTLLVARALSRATGIPLDASSLHKKKETSPQVGLSRSQRMNNLRGAFGTRRRLDGRSVLLVDDVITTGATVRECSKTLMRAGASEVHALSIARSGGDVWDAAGEDTEMDTENPG
jgi:ComF family protein